MNFFIREGLKKNLKKVKMQCNLANNTWFDWHNLSSVVRLTLGLGMGFNIKIVLSAYNLNYILNNNDECGLIELSNMSINPVNSQLLCK